MKAGAPDHGFNAPPVPPVAVQEAFIEMELPPEQSSALPWWCRHFCYNRQLWQGTGLGKLNDEGDLDEDYFPDARGYRLTLADGVTTRLRFAKRGGKLCARFSVQVVLLKQFL